VLFALPHRGTHDHLARCCAAAEQLKLDWQVLADGGCHRRVHLGLDGAQHLSDGLGHMVPPQVVTGPGHKPLSISFEEIAAGKIVRVDEVEVADEAADTAADDAD
jgi:hypothetical protein